MTPDKPEYSCKRSADGTIGATPTARNLVEFRLILDGSSARDVQMDIEEVRSLVARAYRKLAERSDAAELLCAVLAVESDEDMEPIVSWLHDPRQQEHAAPHVQPVPRKSNSRNARSWLPNGAQALAVWPQEGLARILVAEDIGFRAQLLAVRRAYADLVVELAGRLGFELPRHDSAYALFSSLELGGSRNLGPKQRPEQVEAMLDGSLVLGLPR